MYGHRKSGRELVVYSSLQSFIVYDEVLKNYVYIIIYYTVYLLIFNVFGNFKSKLQNYIFLLFIFQHSQ